MARVLKIVREKNSNLCAFFLVGFDGIRCGPINGKKLYQATYISVHLVRRAFFDKFRIFRELNIYFLEFSKSKKIIFLGF